MKWKELKDKSESELKKMIKDLRESLRDMRFKAANNQLKNVRDIRTVKKNIAQILTLLKQQKTKQTKSS